MTDFRKEAENLVESFPSANSLLPMQTTQIAFALRSAYERGIEDAAKVADDYADRMTETMNANLAKNKPSLVADCKADAGNFIGNRIRALKDQRP